MPLPSDTWALLPIKSLDQGKSRLSPVLNPEQRALLIPAMLEDVLEAIVGTPALKLLLVTGDDRVAQLAASRGISSLLEEVCISETHAIETATRHACSLGAKGTLVVPADIPLVQPADLNAVLESAPEQGTVMVPAWDGRGTNAVLRRPADLFPLRFGNDSFLPHSAAAEQTQLPCIVVQNDRIALDVDSPSDLARFMEVPSSTRTRRVLESFQLAQVPML
jgi:2-phospho-L-lactate guanylyltransferase